MFLKDLYNRLVGSVLAFWRWEWVGVKTLGYACIHIFKITIPNGAGGGGGIHILNKRSKEIILKGSTVGQNSRS